MNTQSQSNEEHVKESSFKFEKFVVKESHINRKPGLFNGKFKININPSGSIDEKNNNFILKLEVTISDDNDTFTASVIVIAWFEFNKETSAESLNNYFYINAPALIFPYIRAYISALTALSGLPAINLPILNIVKLGEDLKQNTNVLKEELE